MNITKTRLSKFAFCTALGGAFFAPTVALAQAATPAPAPAAVPPAPAQPVPGGPGAASGPAPAPAAAPEPAPAVVTPVPGAEAAPPPAEPAPAPAAEAPPPPPEAPKEEELPPIDVGAWLRVNMDFQGAGADAKKLNDQSMGIYGELHLGGKVHKNVSYTLNFNANGKGAAPGIMDLIIGLDFMDEFHLWSGQLLTPVDRSNFSGPFFISPWAYPGVMGGGAAVITPNGEWNSGRDVGSVVWGDIGKGTFKYYLALTHLAPKVADPAFLGGGSPLISGRLAYAAIGKEPGYYGSSTYYGDQDVLALGVGAQTQKNGSRSAAGVDDYSEFNADVLAEFTLGGGSAITGEGAFYHYAGDFNPADNQFFILASYLSPPIGPGKLQPMVRYQQAKKKDVDAMSQIDAQLAYVVKGAAMRGILGFSHTDLGSPAPGADKVTMNVLQIGLQAIAF